MDLAYINLILETQWLCVMASLYSGFHLTVCVATFSVWSMLYLVTQVE